ncbi:hypothetical protein DBR06_SOUSAS14510026, partial [Sousa chinensis]
HAIRLAGRESWLEDPFPSDIYQMVDEIACALLPVLQGENFAFFGHSIGSYVTFMPVLHLKEKYKLEPVHLFVSGISKARLCFSEDLSEEQITCLLKDLGGTPVDFVDDKAFLQPFPKLVTDSPIVSNSIFDTPSEAVLSCESTCITVSEDTPADLEAWEDVTSGSFDIRALPGCHFYLLEPSNEIFIKSYITKSLEVSMLHCCW